MRPSSPHTRRIVLLPVLVLVAALVAACGGGEPGSDGADGSGAGAAGSAEGMRALSSTTPLEGEPLDVDALEGAPTVLWFWAPWCTSCRKEAPAVSQAVERFGDRVRVVGVPARGDLEEMRRFVEETATGGVDHFADLDGRVWRSFGVITQPSFAFIGPDGTSEVHSGRLGEEGLNQRIEALLSA